MPPPTTPPVFSSTTAYLLINGTPHISKIDINLRHSSHDRQLRLYITEREDWAQATSISSTGQPFSQICMNRSTNHHKRAAVKLSFHQWAADYELHKRTPRSHDHRCKHCNRHTKTFDHIFTCTKSTLATTGAISAVVRNFL
jgi:hypothetical protein